MIARLNQAANTALGLPAVQRQVRALEVELRETLLLRNGRGVVLTEAGQRFYEHGVNILQALAQAQDDMGASRDAPVGRITIGLPPSVGRQLTLPLIDGFQRRLPAARLVIVEGLSSHLSEWISTGRVDLEITPLIEESLCLVSPAASAAPTPGSDPALPLHELPAWPLIVPERGHAIRKLLQTQAVLAATRLLTELVKSLPQGAAAPSQPG